MSLADPLSLVGTTVSEKYEIERVVGEGGFAVVYKATHKVWNRAVAINSIVRVILRMLRIDLRRLSRARALAISGRLPREADRTIETGHQRQCKSRQNFLLNS